MLFHNCRFTTADSRSTSPRKNKCNAERDDRADEAIHKNAIRNPKQPIFSREHHTKKINILDHTTIQVIFIFHHFFHRPIIIRQLHIEEITEKKQIDLLILNILTRKTPSTDIWPRSEDGKNGGA